MSSFRTVHVPLFSSQPGSGQGDDSQPDPNMDKTEPPCQGQRGGNKRGNFKREKNPFVLKVKLPKLNKKVDQTRRVWALEPIANKSRKTVSGGGAQCNDAGTGTGSDTVGEDAFFFSQKPTSKAITGKEKAKLAVLRTISKVLEENQLIRQRLTPSARPTEVAVTGLNAPQP